ncbi:MAG: PspC domain-containing protein [Dehalococcoidia bacterium]
MNRLYRSRDDKILAGILGGLAEALKVDPSILRLGFVFLGFITGCIPALVAYLVG